MVSTNFSQQDQTQTNVYRYNYTYLEPIAMVDTLPKDQNFSVPWIVLAGQQVLKLVINTLIVDLGSGERRGSNDVVKDFFAPGLSANPSRTGNILQIKADRRVKGIVSPDGVSRCNTRFLRNAKGSRYGLATINAIHKRKVLHSAIEAFREIHTITMKGYIKDQGIILLEALPETIKEGDNIEVTITPVFTPSYPFPTFDLGVKDEYLNREKLYEPDANLHVEKVIATHPRFASKE